MKPRIKVITLAVADLQRSLAWNPAWTPAPARA
jgi:hypothetical protein